MKILIVSPFFPPRNVVAAWRAYSWVKAWKEMGHDLTVLTAEDPASIEGTEELVPQLGVEILRAKQGVIFDRARATLKNSAGGGGASGEPSPWRLLSLRVLAKIKSFLQSSGVLASVRWPDPWIFWKKNAEELVRGRSFDVVVCTFGPVSSIQIGAKLRRSNQARMFVADFRDLWTGNSSYQGIWFLRPIEALMEQSILRYADLISTVSAPLRESLQRLVPTKKVEVVPNGFEAALVDDLGIQQSSSDKVVISYTGTIYLPHQSPRSLFKIVRRLKSKIQGRLQIDFYGPNSEVLRPLVDEYELSDVVNLNGIVPRDQSIRIQRSSSALLFLESTGTPGREGIVTGKIFEYLASRRPVIAVGVSKSSIVGQLIEETCSGVCVEREEAMIENAIMTLLQSGTLGVNPKGLPLRFERRQIALDFLNLIENEFAALKKANAK